MIIEVQHCVDCHLHNWCSRHNEAKYHEFYQNLESKVRSAFKRVDIIKNNPPKHFQQKNNSMTVCLQLHNYFDEQTNQEVVFPRHGAFQIKVNGILIFSKLQSNLWPNLQKIINLLKQISTEVQAGKDIKIFSLQYRLENNKQELAETFNKLIKFKINKRPQSSFNATAYVLRGTNEQSPQFKPEKFKKKNVTNMKKGTYYGHHKSDVSKKPLINFGNSKLQTSNTFGEFRQAKNEQTCQFPQVGKIVKNQNGHSKKRLQFKSDALHPIIAQPFDSIENNNSSGVKLEKKPSRKLILKTNEKKSENSPHFLPHVSHKYNQNFEDSIDAAERLIIKQNTLFFAEVPTKKSLKSVMSIGDNLQNKEPNDIKVQDYTQKIFYKNEQKIQLEAQAFGPNSLISLKDKTSKKVNQSVNPHQQVVKNIQKQQQICKEQSTKQKQKQPSFAEEQYEIQQNDEQIRPQTSSSHRKYKQGIVEKEEEILEYGQAKEVNFFRKTSKVEERINDQNEQELAVEEQEFPIQQQKLQRQQKIIQEQVFQLTIKDRQICQPKQISQGKQAGLNQKSPQIAYQEVKIQPQMSLQISKEIQQNVKKEQQKEQIIGEKEVIASQQNSQKQLLNYQIQTPIQKQVIISQQSAKKLKAQSNQKQEPEIEQQQFNQGQQKVKKAPQQQNVEHIQDKTEPIVLTHIQQLIKINQKQAQQTQIAHKQQNQSYEEDFLIKVQQKSSAQNDINQKLKIQQVEAENQREQISKLQQQTSKNCENKHILVQNEQMPVQTQRLQQARNSPIQPYVEQQKFSAISQKSNQLLCPQPNQKIISKEKVQKCGQLPIQAENVQTAFEVKQTHQEQQTLQDKVVEPQQNLEIQIQSKPIQQKELFEQQIIQDLKIHQNIQKKIEEQQKIVKQDQQAIQQKQQVKQVRLSDTNDDKPVIKPQTSNSNQKQAKKAEQAQKQIIMSARLPSISLTPNKETNSESQRSLPNATQSSIGLSSQIHLELYNVYEQIQAKFDARLILDQEDNS